MSRLKLLADVTLDAFLLANASIRAVGDGRAWERDVGRLIARPSLPVRQSAGRSTLFEMRSASGAGHEIDAAAEGRVELLIAEAKANGDGVTKSEISHFHVKTFDYYCAQVKERRVRWWRIMISGTPVKRSARALCAHLGIQLCDTAVLPLPVLLWTAGRPTADLYFPEKLLQEAVRLFEPAVVGLDQRWRFNQEMQQIEFALDDRSATKIDDLLFIQSEMSAAVLDFYDRHAPLRLPKRTAKILRMIPVAA